MEMEDQELKRLALVMTLCCVRNTCIEDYHCAGKLTDSEMKAFNKQVSNRIFTFLCHLFAKPKPQRDAFLSGMERWAADFIKHWDTPELDEKLLTRRQRKPARQH